MDINDTRTLVTLVSFIAFVAIVAWALSSRRSRRFNDAARAPIEDDDLPRAEPTTRRLK
jgi:cytochrome c oxidase cbb3-type subunit IV